MQYSNKQSIKTLSAATRVSIAILTVLLMLPVLGNFPSLKQAFPIFFILWLLIILFTFLGGIDELYITIGHGHFEILKSRFISTSSHRQVVISTSENNIVRFRYYRILFTRIARITYIAHDGSQKTKAISLTMVEKAKRHEFIRELATICKQNSNN